MKFNVGVNGGYGMTAREVVKYMTLARIRYEVAENRKKYQPRLPLTDRDVAMVAKMLKAPTVDLFIKVMD